jgi:aldehyde dehydrogenase (NAD+)
MLMMKLADLMEQNKELLATIDAWDNGTEQLKEG